MRKNNLFFSLLLLCGMLVSCGGSSSTNDGTTNTTVDDVDTPIPTINTYDNKFGEDKIPNQWSEYGIGDPFVYRFNGTYYLYCSTKNFETGVRGWKSDDLLNWKPITGEGLETGYVSNDENTVTAYAPEVIYNNGYFYMCESEGGSGHYILRSEKPEGPFVSVTDNFGESIDGSFFIDDDEQMYFLRASNAGIRLVQVNDDLTMGKSKTLDNTQIGGWTEGPYLLKRDGIYYLTYTGNNVISPGYRIGYSYSSDKLFERDAFTQGETIALSTDSNFNGLGHSSTVLGPNLDSYYIAYHNLNSSGGPNRSFNLSRLTFNGTEMSINHPELHNNIVPDLPVFKGTNSNSLVENGDFLLSNASSNGSFSSEYNFVGNNNNFVFSFIDEQNYSFVNVLDKNITLKKVTNGSEEILGTSTLTKTYDFSKLHTIRLAYSNNKIDVYFDTMNKLSKDQISFENGKIGYKKADTLTICTTILSNYAHGNSENELLHQESVLANNYSSLKNGNLIKQTAGENPDYFNGKVDTYDLVLVPNGYAKYKMWVESDGTYGIDLNINKKYCGKKIIIQVDSGTKYRMTIPENNGLNEDYFVTTIGDYQINAGSHYLKIYAENDEIGFHKISLFMSSSTYPKFEDTLENYVSKGATYITPWKLLNNGHYALSGNRNLLYFGDGTFTDFTMEIDIELVGETQASTCGILLRGDNPAFASSDDFSSIQGYYVGFNNSKLFISKCDYNYSNIDASADAYAAKSNNQYHFKVVVRGNTITLDFNNGEISLSYTDPNAFTHGKIGLYTDGAACIYRNLKIYY